jgi:tetratricopeptide (TPR) repeat protein
MVAMDRIAMLQQLLAEHPNEALPRYSLAMEYSNAGNIENALAEFGKLLALHPDYANGYFMAAQVLARAGNTEAAKEHLRKGISAADRTRNAHARAEMEGMLDELGG